MELGTTPMRPYGWTKWAACRLTAAQHRQCHNLEGRSFMPAAARSLPNDLERETEVVLFWGV